MEIVEEFLNGVMQLLPLSPFAPYINQLAELKYLNYLNYFVPVGTCIDITLAWVTAIVLYYTYSIILRWIRAIS